MSFFRVLRRLAQFNALDLDIVGEDRLLHRASAASHVGQPEKVLYTFTLTPHQRIQLEAALQGMELIPDNVASASP